MEYFLNCICATLVIFEMLFGIKGVRSFSNAEKTE